MPIKFVGRTTFCKGKTLWEILGNLKDFGVGRIVVRETFERYPEKSWLKVLKVKTQSTPPGPRLDNVTLNNPMNYRKVTVIAEKVWRGHKYPEPCLIDRVSYKPDYRLLSKKEEKEYCQLLDESALPKPLPLETIPFPPLLKEMLKLSRGDVQEPRLKLTLRHNRDNKAPLPKGHLESSSDIPINQGLGTPKSLKFYDNVLQ